MLFYIWMPQLFTLLNPFNEKEFEASKQTIVDIKVRDSTGKTYQVEVQIQIHAALPERMIYTWGSIFQEQLQEGESFEKLQPLISLWILGGKLNHTSAHYHHHFQLWDTKRKTCLSQHCSIHVVELGKWRKKANLTEEEQWLYCLKEASKWTELPPTLNNPDITEAMKIVRTITEKEQEWDRYQARKQHLHLMATIIEERNKMVEKAEKAEKEKQLAQKAHLEAEQQIQQLLERLKMLENG